MSFVLIFICFAFEKSLFIFAKVSHRAGAVVVSERDVRISFNSCFIFVLRKYIHESTEFVLIVLIVLFFFFFGCFWLVTVFFFSC